MPGATCPSPPHLVRESCAAAKLHECVQVDEDALRGFARNVPLERVRMSLRGARGVQLPFRFDDLKAEVSFIAMFNLLDFGSGYDRYMEVMKQSDTKECVQRGLIGLYLSLGKMDADVMNNATEFKIAEVCRIPARVDAPHPQIPGLTVEKEGPMAPFVKSLSKTLNSVGLWLWERQYNSLGDFIVQTLEDETKNGNPPTAAAFVKALAESLPDYYNDVSTMNEAEIYFYRKAQIMATTLHLRFKDDHPGLFDFKDIDELTAAGDSMLAASLQIQGILKYDATLTAKIAAGHALLPGSAEENSLRAASVNAIEKLVALTGGNCNAVAFDHFLRQEWRSAKPSNVPRPPSVAGTLFY